MHTRKQEGKKGKQRYSQNVRLSPNSYHHSPLLSSLGPSPLALRSSAAALSAAMISGAVGSASASSSTWLRMLLDSAVVVVVNGCWVGVNGCWVGF